MNYLPAGYHNVTPYLVVEDAARLVDFLEQVFGATEKEMMKTPDGRIMHAEVKIGDSVIMMGEPGGRWKPMPGCCLRLRGRYRRGVQTRAGRGRDISDGAC